MREKTDNACKGMIKMRGCRLSIYAGQLIHMMLAIYFDQKITLNLGCSIEINEITQLRTRSVLLNPILKMIAVFMYIKVM